MSDIIFAYTIPDTNWLNPAWRRAKMKELHEIEERSNFIDLDNNFPDITHKAMAMKLGISYGYYMQLRKRYGLESRSQLLKPTRKGGES